MNSNHVLSKNTLFAFKYQSHQRRTTSTIIGNQVALSMHKTSSSIGTTMPYFDSDLERIKIEIKERLKEQQKREEFLANMLQLDNEPANAELYTETTRKSDVKTSESTLNDQNSYFFCFRKLFSKCFWS